MKKFIIVSAFVIGAFAVNAQNAKNALQGIKIGDNWSVELKGGMVTPLTHSSFFKDARPAFGLGVGKQLTPAFGMEIQGVGYVNTTDSKNAIDVSDISLLNKFNLMNLFGGYPGTPRLFEIEAVAGIGWMHAVSGTGTFGRQDGGASGYIKRAAAAGLRPGEENAGHTPDGVLPDQRAFQSAGGRLSCDGAG